VLRRHVIKGSGNLQCNCIPCMGGAWVRANNGVGLKGGTGDEEMEKQRDVFSTRQARPGGLVVLPAKGSLGTRPSENQTEGLGERLGRKCTVCPECRCTSNWFMIAYLHGLIGNTNCNPLV